MGPSSRLSATRWRFCSSRGSSRFRRASSSRGSPPGGGTASSTSSSARRRMRHGRSPRSCSRSCSRSRQRHSAAATARRPVRAVGGWPDLHPGLRAQLGHALRLPVGRQRLHVRLERLPLPAIPGIALAAGFLGLHARHLRAGVLETMDQPYITTARAKGLSEERILVRHVLRIAIAAFISGLLADIGAIFGAALAVDVVFRLNGLGTLLISLFPSTALRDRRVRGAVAAPDHRRLRPAERRARGHVRRHARPAPAEGRMTVAEAAEAPGRRGDARRLARLLARVGAPLRPAARRRLRARSSSSRSTSSAPSPATFAPGGWNDLYLGASGRTIRRCCTTAGSAGWGPTTSAAARSSARSGDCTTARPRRCSAR